MNKVEKVQFAINTLQGLYPKPTIPLASRDPYTHLIAVLLSAQCTDARVNTVTPTLFKRADRPQKMVKLEVEEIRQIIRSCGLAPRKSQAIWGLSRILLDEHGGEVPVDMEALELLPGVGHKTAQVVMAQNFGVATFPVDTHIHRLAARWGLSNGSSVVRSERDLKRLFPSDSWNRLHLQIIYFGREHCPARGHDLAACPVCGWAATRKRIAEEARKNAPRKR